MILALKSGIIGEAYERIIHFLFELLANVLHPKQIYACSLAFLYDVIFHCQALL